ncbi:MAG: hypothetical protein ACYC06_06725 [Ilumatobacteraceae bacterium]
MTHNADNAREVLRTVWDAQGDAGAILDEECSPTKTCRNMVGVSFDGFAEPGSDIGAAWREKLAREGKLNTSGESIRDLVLRATEPR